MLETELLVVGGGVAGAYATLTARSYGADVILACKTPLVGGSTRWAQGGIAAPLAEGDEDAHAQDTVKAGRGLCEPEAVQAFVRDARSHVETLRDLGVTFSPHATLEGGHSRARIRHQGDATGHAISLALAEALQAGRSPALRVLEHAFVRNLRVSGGAVVGADLLTPDGPVRVRAGQVLLVWNDWRAVDTPFNRTYGEVVRAFTGDDPLRTRVLEDELPQHLPGGFTRHTFTHGHPLMREGLRALATSVSYLPNRGDETYPALERALDGAFDRHAHGGGVTLAYQTQAFLGRLD
nr:FAD-binding protein [Deinococcus sp. RM]